MPDEHRLTLRQAEQAREDFAEITAALEFVIGQLARLPTRREMYRTALLGVVAGACLVEPLALLLL